MGIPTFFRSILKTNPRVIQGAEAHCLGTVHAFFIDFNSLIYKSWQDVLKEKKKEEEPLSKIEARLIQKVVEQTLHLSNEVVVPVELLYLSMDGPAPKSKIVQQRSRRYKSVQSAQFLKGEARRLRGVASDDDHGARVSSAPQWDPSCNICPGTRFMYRLSKALEKAICQGRFMTRTVVLSDSNVPGEGEHKMLPRIRQMNRVVSEREQTVVIYSPDGDMISLALLTKKPNVFILRYADALSEMEKPWIEKGYPMIYSCIDKIRHDFYVQMTRTYSSTIEETRILLDYNFLLAMVGNDFVPSLPFLKIRSGGMDLLLRIYNDLRRRFPNEYLVHTEPVLGVHRLFFQEMVVQLSKCEHSEMRKEHEQALREFYGQGNRRREEQEERMTPYEKLESRYYHMSLFHPNHPLSKTYRGHLHKIDYSQEKHLWKQQYYSWFTGVDASDKKGYNDTRTRMVHNYLESLLFTLHYYVQGCPSWTWYYRYRVAPMPSDIFTVLSKQRFDMNSIRFTRNEPLTPFQQLMMILPMNQIEQNLPPDLMTLARSPGWSFYYPAQFEVDALAGNKYIYCEAVLPEMESDAQAQAFVEEIRQVEEQLDASEQARNRVTHRVKVKKREMEEPSVTTEGSTSTTFV